MQPQSVDEQLRNELMQWAGVSLLQPSFGGLQVQVGRRSFACLPGNGQADVLLPKKLRDLFVASGQVRPHPTLPDSCWVTVSLRSPSRVQNAVNVIRAGYDYAKSRDEVLPRRLLSVEPG
ncbi:luciferase domain-containing protein [Planctomicrobium piriforme]|uniref:Luciferase domain-containing protein n=1 Tax=Planctomicrobium piriforme TaxID=1576369 RepID=A0A1I3RS08_9PLAN|nr:luciferase family protein [Planctomicrobium piriforme]SFJ48840.1 hypothetical protein SAMN05421753_12197 [Planctomicrobium piriforme]